MIHFDSSRAFGRATYYVNKLFAENLPTYNLNTEVDFKPAPSPIRFQLGFGTYNTAAEFKDAYVEREGKVIYHAAFNDASDWKSPAGHWTADQGIYRQSEEAVVGLTSMIQRLQFLRTNAQLCMSKRENCVEKKGLRSRSEARKGVACNGTSEAGAIINTQSKLMTRLWAPPWSPGLRRGAGMTSCWKCKTAAFAAFLMER